ncbi:MAG: response regulator transcription factor [Pleurocapsa sp. SU_5_0]|nr:response regulator transcription factor [Pleurocapsa sp. SU_5_0]NJO98641.1 response regulator transcription factor [Pleurocapsa sp. CRU_1_2]NJR47775.1 response regulator transcription factor [Hyellaceae cyanobacterium CSU_1_1]
MKQILIVEDETRIAAFIAKGLKAKGYNTTIVEDAETALATPFSCQFDLALLDLGLPGQDGLTVLETWRGQGVSFPVIILTARDDVMDKVAGFKGGADDYMTKPFSFAELLARIEVRLKASNNSQQNQAKMQIQQGNMILDLRTRKIYIGDREVELPAREFTMAEVFFRHPGQVLTRQQLLDLVWGYDYDPGSNIVDVYVGYLRKKLGSTSIETVRGMGYRLGSG